MLDDLYKLSQTKIKKKISEGPIFLMFDETTDCVGRYILNILIGKCSEIKRSQPLLVKSVEITKTNSKNVNFQIIQLLNILYNNVTSKYTNIKLLLSDRAPYALKAGTLLKDVIPGLKHVTCLCHALHNLAESIRASAKTVNKIVSF